MLFTRIYLLAILLAAAWSCGGDETGNKEEEAKSADTSQVPVFIEQFPEPPNDRFNGKVIDIGSFEALFKNMGSNRTLRLTADIILPEKWTDKSNINLEMKYGLIVSGLSNLKIIGGGQKPSRIIQPHPLYKVMEMYKCENIVFENIIAGHEPEKGSCAAGVLVFSECTDIFIYKSILFGSGYEGITTYKTKSLNCRQTTIRECSFRILSLSQSENCRFLDCTFADNNLPHGAGRLYLAGTDRIIFNKCVFRDNAAYIGAVTEDPFFQVEDCLDVYIKECSFTKNKARYLVLRDKDLKLINNKTEGNGWEKEPANKPL